MRQPIRNGMRQPQAIICSSVSSPRSVTPMTAAKTTATCWLADCQLT